jgi:hypothetical protein
MFGTLKKALEDVEAVDRLRSLLAGFNSRKIILAAS